MIGQVLGHYRVLEKIGEGGMGVVYRAHDERLDRDVALKVLPVGALGDEPARRRFRREALALSKLNHPNIGMVFDFDTQDGVDFLVMEHIHGHSLDQDLRAGPLEEKQVVRLGMQLAEGLAAAHAERVIHCDLKPANLRLAPDGRLKILDFGLARLLPQEDPAARTASLSQNQGVTGTLPYMSPEQLRGEKPDARSDIWATGAVLYEMATGRRPFESKLSTALANEIINTPAPPPGRLNPLVSARMEDIILKCLEKEPENRYQSANDLGVDLRRLTAIKVPAYVPKASTRMRWQLVVAVLGLPFLLLATFLTLNMGGWRERLLGRTNSTRIESLAVLPLENLSGDAEQDYFADGMTEALITNLAQISALRVTSRTSVMKYKGARRPLPEIARELNVDGVVEGSVQRSGDRVKVTAQLIHARTDRHMWARSYERELRDVLSLQSEVAGAIANEIKVTLTPQEQVRLTTTRPVNPQAHEAYFRGLYSFNQGRDGPREEPFRKGIHYFEQAIQIDPGYALAYAGLARSYHWLAGRGHPELYASSRAAAVKALEIDESTAEAHAALAFVMFRHEWDWVGAEREFKRAIELNPNYSDAHQAYSLYLSALGRHDQAVAEIDRAQELDPLTRPLKINAGWTYLCANQHGRAIERFRSLIELDASDPSLHVFLGLTYVAKGMREQGLAELRKGTEHSRNDPELNATLAWGYAVSGRRVEATKLLGDLMRLDKREPYLIATVHAGLEERDEAMAWLKKAYEGHSSSLVFIKCDKAFDSLRSDSRFQDLVRRMNFPP